MDRRMVLGGAAGLLGVGSVAATGLAEDKPADVCCMNCNECRLACLACVAACLNEAGRKECIKACLDCADICTTCSNSMARKGPMSPAIMALCADACEKCAAECEKHKDDKACKACAEECRNCAKKCRAASKGK